MKNILELGFKVSRGTTAVFFMWIAITGMEFGFLYGGIESGESFQSLSLIEPIFGLVICVYGWRKWYRIANKEREDQQEYLENRARMHKEIIDYFNELASHKNHFEQSNSDKP